MSSDELVRLNFRLHIYAGILAGTVVGLAVADVVQQTDLKTQLKDGFTHHARYPVCTAHEENARKQVLEMTVPAYDCAGRQKAMDDRLLQMIRTNDSGSKEGTSLSWNRLSQRGLWEGMKLVLAKDESGAIDDKTKDWAIAGIVRHLREETALSASHDPDLTPLIRGEDVDIFQMPDYTASTDPRAFQMLITKASEQPELRFWLPELKWISNEGLKKHPLRQPIAGYARPANLTAPAPIF